MTNRALFAGSFDPFTIGHLDIVNRTLTITDEIVVAIGVNIQKTPLFPVEQRCSMLKHLFRNGSRVHVVAYDGLTVSACKQHNANLLVRGVRTSADMEKEWALATINKELSGIETILLPSGKQYSHISSSFIRDIIRNGGDVSSYLPEEIHNFIQ